MLFLGCVRRGELLLQLQRPEAALRDCDRALELNPDSGKAYKTRGRANAKLKRWTAAHADFQELQHLLAQVKFKFLDVSGHLKGRNGWVRRV